MDTPFKPDGLKKRKLKKILKKKPTILNSSLSSNAYQKKVKAAINVSLNSTRNVRTLQTNNRSLANGLERWKQECRIAQDKCNYLLQTNHDLREYILELERKISSSPSYIKEEVERQYKLRIKKIQSDVCDLFNGLLENILQVTSDTSGFSDTSLLNLDLPFSPSHFSGIQPLEEVDDEVLGPYYKRNKPLDLSLINEQSVLLPAMDGLQEYDAREKSQERAPCTQEKSLSKLPLRIPVQRKRKSELNNLEIRKSLTPELRKSLTPAKSLVTSPKTTPKTDQSSDAKVPTKTLTPKDSPKNKSASLKALHGKKKSPKSKIKSAKKTVKSLTWLKTSPKIDAPIITNEFALVNNHLEMIKKIQFAQQNNDLNGQLGTGVLSVVAPSAFETNFSSRVNPSFSYTNHDSADQPPTVANCTNISVVDMELTQLVTADTLPATTSLVEVRKPDTEDINESSIEDVRKEKTTQADDISQSEEPIIDNFEWVDQKFPDAVTLRRGKPGQILFAASRKDPDGTRKNLPVVPPTKSRSKKKKMNNTSESFSESDPQSIFDFHDKTPKGLGDVKSKDLSIFNITGDVSTTSPLPSLNTFKQSQSSKEKNYLETVALPKDVLSLLGDEPEYEMPLKCSPSPVKSKVHLRTRSQSRSKKRKEENAENTGRSYSESRKISALSPDSISRSRNRKSTSENISSVSDRGRSRSRKSPVLCSEDIQIISKRGRSKSRKSPLLSSDDNQFVFEHSRSKSGKSLVLSSDDQIVSERGQSKGRKSLVLSSVDQISSERCRSNSRKSAALPSDDIQSLSEHERSMSRDSPMLPSDIQSFSKGGRSKSKPKEQSSPNSEIINRQSKKYIFSNHEKGTEEQYDVDIEKIDQNVSTINLTKRMTSFLSDQQKSLRLSVQSAWHSPWRINKIESLIAENNEGLQCTPNKEPWKEIDIHETDSEVEKPKKISLGLQKGKAVIKELKKRERRKFSSEVKKLANKNNNAEALLQVNVNKKTESQEPAVKTRSRTSSLESSNSFEVLAEVHPIPSTVCDGMSKSINGLHDTQQKVHKDVPVLKCIQQESISDEIETVADFSIVKEKNVQASKLTCTQKKLEKNKSDERFHSTNKYSPHTKKSKKEILKLIDPQLETNLLPSPIRSTVDTVSRSKEIKLEEDSLNRDSFEKATSQILSKVKDLKTPKITKDVKSDNHQQKKSSGNENASPQASIMVKKTVVPQKPKTSHHAKVNTKTLGDIDPNTQQSTQNKSPRTSPALKTKRSNPELTNSDVPELKKRRAATKVQNYSEFSLKAKLRRGDPISSHYCSSENIDIYKEKIRGKTKKALQSTMESLHNQSIQEEN
ncbi:serine/arginine repetitive matrix protein 2 [Biomphalaria pfeifferi]|uniref:Serine/arginine repetitive matrix protein 2 n=1 Tax=Biomphalaria pfeifferi TaxID=112525 RepID=A0AAD8F9F7_BIOPF|nr:serine/arginine repetitive matrix protein 2 [Biomphalaria pfeifferi]